MEGCRHTNPRIDARAESVTTAILFRRAVGPLECNCYFVGDPATKEVIVIDPGGDPDILTEALAERQLKVSAIVATHAHFDHIIAGERMRALTGAPFYLHDADRPLLDWMQTSGRVFLGVDLPPPPEVDRPAPEGEILTAGAARLEVLHTPGHSPGSITLVAEDAIFAGDTLFAGSVGRTDLPGGDTATLVRAIQERLFSFDDDIPVYPGHGPHTTIGTERRFNPFVRG
jgi:hydroxyacylglutathione hydrolase